MRVRRSLLAVLAFALLASACTGSDDPSTPTASATGPTSSSLSMEVASSDLAVGGTQHFEVGIFSSDGQGVQLLSFGQMSFGFSYLGDGSGTPQPGPAGGRDVRRRVRNAAGRTRADVHRPERRARHLPGGRRRSTGPGPGRWTRRSTSPARGPRRSPRASSWRRSTRCPLPATGRKATENLTIDSKGVPPAAIDSRALDGAPVPDPELHQDDHRRRARPTAADPGALLDAGVLREPDVRAGDRRPGSARRSSIRTAPCSSTSRSGATTRRAW